MEKPMASSYEGRAQYVLIKDALKRDEDDWKRVLALIQEQRLAEAEGECKRVLARIESSLCR